MKLESFSIKQTPFCGTYTTSLNATMTDRTENGFICVSLVMNIPDNGMISQVDAERLIRQDLYAAVKKLLQPPNQDDSGY